MQEEFQQQLKRLKFDSTRTLKSLQNLKSKKPQYEKLSFAKSKPTPKDLSPENILKPTSQIKSLKTMKQGQLESTSKNILSLIPKQVPLLNLKNLQTRATSATQRSYLTSHKNKLKKDLTPPTKRPAEPLIYEWLRSQGFSGNFKKDAQSGVLLCDLINKLEKKSVLRDFFKPVKSQNAAKMNLRKVFSFLKTQEFESNFLDFYEVYAGSDAYILGLLEDIKRYYEGHSRLENDENRDLVEAQAKKWVRRLGFKWESFAKPSKIGELIVRIIEQCYKIQISGIFASDSIENSKKNIELALKTLVTLNLEISLKYYKDSDLILTSPSVFYSFIQDIHESCTEKFPSTDPKGVIMWLNALKLLNSAYLYEIVPKCKTGEFFLSLAETLTSESLPYTEAKGTFQRLKNIRTAFDVLFSYNLIRNIDESIILSVSQGDLKVITGILSVVKNIVESCGNDTVLEQPQEFLTKNKCFRSVTPPKSMLDI